MTIWSWLAKQGFKMWVNSKTAAAVFSVNHNSIVQAVSRATKQGKKICSVKCHICHFMYSNGIGRGGKVLQIWIDDEIIANFENKRSGDTHEVRGGFLAEQSEAEQNKRSAFSQSEKCFLENKRSGDTHEVRGGFLAEQSEAEQNTNGVRVSQNGISHGCGGGEVVGGVRKNGDCAVGGACENVSGAVGACDSMVCGGCSAVGEFANLQNNNLNIGDCHEFASASGEVIGSVSAFVVGGSVASYGVAENSSSVSGSINRHETADTVSCNGGVGSKNNANSHNDNRDGSVVGRGVAGNGEVVGNSLDCFVSCDTRNDNKSVVGENGSGGGASKGMAGVGDVCIKTSEKVGGEFNGGENISGASATISKKDINFLTFATASKSAKEVAMKRSLIINEWEKAKKVNEKVAEFIKKINQSNKFNIKLSKNKLYAWLRAYSERGLDGLVDGRGKDRVTQIEKSEFKGVADELIMAQKGRFNYLGFYRLMNYKACELGYLDFSEFNAKKSEYFSYDQTTRYAMKFLRKNEFVKQLITRGDDALVSSKMPSLGRANWEVTSINQIVEIDASPLDAITNASDLAEKIGYESVSNLFENKEQFIQYLSEQQRRYTLICLIDEYSGVSSFYLAESENANAIARATAKYIKRYGKPAIIKGDNGKGFLAKANMAFLTALGIEYRKVQAYSGWKKPYIETNFKSLQNGLIEQLNGFIGHNISQRQVIEFFKSKKERRLKRGQKTNLANLKDLENMQYLIDVYTEKVLNTRYLERLNNTPAGAYNEKIAEAVMIDDIKVSLYMAKPLRRKVLKNGISINGMWFFNAEIFNYDEIIIRANLNNEREYFAFDLDHKFIGVCSLHDKEIGVSVEVAKAAQKVFAKRKKAAKEQIESARSKNEAWVSEFFTNVKALGVADKKVANSDVGVNNRLMADRSVSASVEDVLTLTPRQEKKDEVMGYEEIVLRLEK